MKHTWQFDVATDWLTLDFGIGFARSRPSDPGWNIRVLCGPWLISMGYWS